MANLRFSEIRDFLNTSCDIELLELYRKEFDRRVAKYNTVKNTVKKNENPQTVSQQEKPALPPRNKKRVDDVPTPASGLVPLNAPKPQRPTRLHLNTGTIPKGKGIIIFFQILS